MTRLASGVMCDICGKNVRPQQRCIVFNMHLGMIFGEPCHAHTGKCEEGFRAAQKSEDWRKLPPGPLRTFFEQANELVKRAMRKDLEAFKELYTIHRFFPSPQNETEAEALRIIIDGFIRSSKFWT